MSGTNPGTTLLVDWWSMDDSGDLGAASHAGNDLTNNNTVTSETGKVGSGAAGFDPANSEYLSLGSSLDQQGEMSISLWIKCNGDYTSILGIVGNNTSAGGGSSYYLDFGRTNNEFNFFNSSNAFIANSGSANINDDNWHSVVVVRSGSAGNWTIKFYVDGVLTSTTTGITDNPSASPGNFSIGRPGSFDGQYGDYTLDAVALWSGALTADNVTWLHNSGSGRSYADLSGGGAASDFPFALYHGGLV